MSGLDASAGELITDPDDPRLDPFRGVRERDLNRRDGRFIVESPRLLARLLEPTSRFQAEAVFLSDAQARAKPDLVAAAREVGVNIHLASLEVMSAVAGFPIHRGALAVALRGAPASAEAVLAALGQPVPGARILLVIGVSNHDNIGSLFRNSAAFGVGAALLDAGSSDPLYRKAVRVSTGAILRLPFAHGGEAGALMETVEAAGYAPLALSPGGEAALGDLDPRRPFALMVGAEGPGLPEHVLARSLSVRIDMAPGHDSLNVATAAAVALHALRLAR